jgi:hypothetical protein
MCRGDALILIKKMRGPSGQVVGKDNPARCSAHRGRFGPATMEHKMSLDRSLISCAGTMVLFSVLLTWLVSEWFLLLAAFVGLNFLPEGQSIEAADAVAQAVMDERTLSVPISGNVLPGARGVIELGDVVRVIPEETSPPIFRHNAHDAEMMTGELVGAYEAPLYAILAVRTQLDQFDWRTLPEPVIRLYGQSDDQVHPTLL